MSTSGTGSMNSSGGKLGFMDRHFVTKAADDGQAEVQLAQLAASQASNSEVRSFAQKLVDDHTAVNQELMGIASSKGVKLDKDDAQDRTYRRLAKKSGSDFDREFIEHMIDDHEKCIKMFEKASNDAKDTEIRGFASKHLADLKDHLARAQSLRQTVMPTGREDDNSGRANASGAGTTSNKNTTSGSSDTSGTTNATISGSSGTSSSGTSSSSDSTKRSSR